MRSKAREIENQKHKIEETHNKYGQMKNKMEEEVQDDKKKLEA